MRLRAGGRDWSPDHRGASGETGIPWNTQPRRTMKKLMVLPALGAAAALTYGAAAALSVNQNGAPIQVGEDVSVACAEGATVAAWMYDDASGLVAGARVDITDDPAVNGSCTGYTLYVTPL